MRLGLTFIFLKDFKIYISAEFLMRHGGNFSLLATRASHPDEEMRARSYFGIYSDKLIPDLLFQLPNIHFAFDESSPQRKNIFDIFSVTVFTRNSPEVCLLIS